MEDDFKPVVQMQRRVNPKIHDGVDLRKRKLIDALGEDIFLTFMDQMLERLAGNEFYCFLDGFSGYFQIPIDPKTKKRPPLLALMELCYKRMPFGLCNARGPFKVFGTTRAIISDRGHIFVMDLNLHRSWQSRCDPSTFDSLPPSNESGQVDGFNIGDLRELEKNIGENRSFLGVISLNDALGLSRTASKS
ncbi:hypothetical protein Tco_0507448 [Tanacetum coccineum]